jgi:hypothetical protein
LLRKYQTSWIRKPINRRIKRNLSQQQTGHRSPGSPHLRIPTRNRPGNETDKFTRVQDDLEIPVESDHVLKPTLLMMVMWSMSQTILQLTQKMNPMEILMKTHVISQDC